MDKVKYTGEDIGSEILYSLSKGLYSDPYHVIREYLQNAVDAFPENINMTVQENNIYIYDDGEGMDEKDIHTCRKVGICYKEPEIHVGFRGIGIWAGLIYAKKLRIISSKEGNNQKYVLTIDFENIVKDITKGREAKDPLERTKILIDVLSRHVYLEKGAEEKERHYTKVELIDITENGKKLVRDNDALREYIGATLPVDFPEEFPHKPRVNELLSQYVLNHRTVKVKFNDQPIYKPYPQNTDLLPPEGHMILDENEKQIAYMWECLHSKHKKIKDKNAGLIYKIKGFTVGDTETPRILWENRDDHFHTWYFGEIHFTNREITPNTAREDLEPSDGQRSFVINILKEIKKLRMKARMISKKKRATKKVEEIKHMITKTSPQISKLEKSSLPDLIELKIDTDKSIQDLEYRKKEIKKVPDAEKVKISKNLTSQLKKLSSYKEKIDKEIEKRDTKVEMPAEKTGPKETVKKPENFKAKIDQMKIGSQAKNVLYIVVDILTEITSKEIMDKFIKTLSEKIKELHQEE